MFNTETTQGFLIGNVGAPFIIGFAVGYFAKKALKIALFVGGFAIVVMFITEYYGFTTISDEGLKNTTTVIADGVKSFGTFLYDRLDQISSRGVSAAVGFVTGLKFG